MDVFIFQVMVNVQMLSELEEVIQYKLVPERRETIKEMWWNRLRVRLERYFILTLHLMSCTIYIAPFSSQVNIKELN